MKVLFYHTGLGAVDGVCAAGLDLSTAGEPGAESRKLWPSVECGSVSGLKVPETIKKKTFTKQTQKNQTNNYLRMELCLQR